MKMQHAIKTIAAIYCIWAIGTPHAASAADKPYTYAPETCDFTITFPSPPAQQKRCDNNDNKNCYTVLSYNHVVSDKSAINVRYECKPWTEEKFAIVNILDMRAMADRLGTTARVTPFSTKTDSQKKYKSATFTGFDQPKDADERLYIGQIWMSEKSFLTVEIENIGPQDKKADKIIADLLKSLRPKQNLLPKEKEKEK